VCSPSWVLGGTHQESRRWLTSRWTPKTPPLHGTHTRALAIYVATFRHNLRGLLFVPIAFLLTFALCCVLLSATVSIPLAVFRHPVRVWKTTVRELLRASRHAVRTPRDAEAAWLDLAAWTLVACALPVVDANTTFKAYLAIMSLALATLRMLNRMGVTSQRRRSLTAALKRNVANTGQVAIEVMGIAALISTAMVLAGVTHPACFRLLWHELESANNLPTLSLGAMLIAAPVIWLTARVCRGFG